MRCAERGAEALSQFTFLQLLRFQDYLCFAADGPPFLETVFQCCFPPSYLHQDPPTLPKSVLPFCGSPELFAPQSAFFTYQGPCFVKCLRPFLGAEHGF